jgi:hypothetical protein
VFTHNVSADVGFGEGSSRSTTFNPSAFHSKGDNIFSAGNGIHIIIPQISGTRNTFDAVIVKLENKQSEHESHSSSSGIGLSTDYAQCAAMMGSMNLGAGGSRDTFLNDAFVTGATDFMQSQVVNQGCCIMDITNHGASYQYIPMEEVHKSNNFAICLSGLDLSSPDAFAYSLGRSLLSSAAAAGVGTLASEAGLGGFVSSLAASLAGTYVNSEVMPQRNFSDDPNWRPTGLGFTGSVEFEHNGHGFHAVNIDFNQKAFRETIDNLKTRILGECLDQNIPVEEAMEIVEDQIADFEEEVVALAHEAGELQKPLGETPPSPTQPAEGLATPSGTVEDEPGQQFRRENADIALQMTGTDPLDPQSQMEADLSHAFHEISMRRVELTPQEKVLAYKPKNPYEAKVKDLTIFKHRVLDFINRHPEAAEMGMKLISGVAQGWQAVKYAGAAIGGFMSGGPIGSIVTVSGAYAAEETTAAAINTAVTATSNALATQITTDAVLQNEFASTIKICELGLLCSVTPKAAKALNKTVKTQAAQLPTLPRVHLNSNRYMGECKLYEIFRVSDGKPMKIGETARGYDSRGKLIRAQEQCNKFNRQFGEDEFRYRELGTYGSKAEVRTIETKTIIKRRVVDPGALPLNKGVH